jgi:moderate conductance mechanosensitive channel
VKPRFLALAVVAMLSAVAASPTQAAEPGLRGLAVELAADARANFRTVRDDFALSGSDAERLRTAFATALADGTAVRATTFALILVVVGCGLEWLYWTFAAPPLRAVVGTPAATPRQAAGLALRRAGWQGFGLLLFTASTLAAALALPWPADVDAIVIATTALVVAVRGAWILAEIVVSPDHPSLRLAAIEAYCSGLLVAGVAWLALLTAAAVLLPRLLLTAGGVPHLAGAVRVGLGALIAVSLVAAVLVTSPWRDRDGAPRRRPHFPTAFIGASVIVATALLALLGGGRAAALLLDIAAVAAALAASKRIVLFFWRDTTASTEEPATEVLPDMSPLIVLSGARLAIVLLGLAAMLVVLQVPLTALVTGSDPLARVAARITDTAALAFVVHLGWIAVRFAIDRRLRQLAPLDAHVSPTESTRLLTLLPLLRTTLAIAFVLLFTLSALWTLGIQIAPLLAGAGIFGLAIGFGAQTLVRDVISGVFFLIEDVFRVGEYIESGTTTKGTVEHISFRTVALRHHNGPLTFVPYGLLGAVRNDSRDWVIDKFNLPLPLSVDSEKIRKMIKGIGDDLACDPELGSLIREPLKGKLYRVDPGVKIFRCKFMTAPGCQFDVRTAALKRIEAALVEAGIPFAGGGPQTILVRRAPEP